MQREKVAAKAPTGEPQKYKFCRGFGAQLVHYICICNFFPGEGGLFSARCKRDWDYRVGAQCTAFVRSLIYAPSPSLPTYALFCMADPKFSRPNLGPKYMHQL
jgi:hypothetical protein